MTDPDAVRQRLAGWRRGRLLGAGLGWLALALLTGVVAALGTPAWGPLPVDESWSRAAVDVLLAHPLLLGAARLVTWCGTAAVIVPVVVLVTFALLRRGHRLLAWWLPLTALSGWLLNAVLKRLVERPRPVTDGLFLDAHGSSFPSGHAQAAGYAWASLGLVALLVLTGRRAWWMSSACGLLGLGVAVSRVLLGVHWPSDVVAGLSVGLGWLCLTCLPLVTVARRVTASGAPAGS